MPVLPRPAAPAALWRDLRAFAAERERHQIAGLCVAVLMPALIALGFYFDKAPPPPGPQLIYVESWPESRTDAEIVKQNIADQKKLDAARRERQRQFQEIQKKFGM